jgi:hypothetical protein
MKKVDFKIKVGDITTSIDKGFHKVIKIEDRWCGIGHQEAYNGKPEPEGVEYIPLLTYERIYHEDGTPVKRKVLNRCDFSYCKLAKDVLKERINDYYKKIKSYKKLIDIHKL